MIGFLKRWLQERRKEKRRSWKYARKYERILDAEAEFVNLHRQMNWERAVLETQRKKGKRDREYVV
jgi:hypothetical protein